MGHRLSKIYTRTGDGGETGLGDGSRVDKDHARIEALGCVDELISQVGLLLTENLPEGVRLCLLTTQNDLFDLGGELSIPGYAMLDDDRVLRLEAALDRYNAELPPLKEFILPGGSPAAAQAHVARTVCRRAERSLVRLRREAPVQDASLRYLNRLSDLLFVLARSLNRAAGGSDVLWQRTPPPGGAEPPPTSR
ncbi:MAG: cob(I)yrinic acid a,c-diamide adenosyltransferase [Burkholderiales bacterium]